MLAARVVDSSRACLRVIGSAFMKVLVVEDDAKVARFLGRVLREEGYAVDACATGGEAVEQASMGGYDVIILDWMLPDLDGLSVCRELRRAGLITPILMLTARGEVGERVLGLESGADDYLVKPFEIEELLARARALIRRASGFSRLRCSELEIDRVGRRVLLCGEPLDLTGRARGGLREPAPAHGGRGVCRHARHARGRVHGD